MIDADLIPPVDNDELLARFLVNRNEYRANKTVKPKAFLPYSHVELSVNRHRDSGEQELWDIGRQVAALRNRTLHGRTDILASDCRIEPLDVKACSLARPADPIDNPNHADVIGFPTTKEDQLSLAQKLAAKAGPRLSPPGNTWQG